MIKKSDFQTSWLLGNFTKIIAVAVVFIGLGATFYHFTEHWNWVDSFYFVVVTLATVGYGDIVPTTPLTKIFTIFYIIVGISIFLALARAIVLQIVSKRQSHIDRKARKPRKRKKK